MRIKTKNPRQNYIVMQALIPFHTILSFNDPEKVSFSHNVFYPFDKQIQFLSHIYAVVCNYFKFGLVQNSRVVKSSWNNPEQKGFWKTFRGQKNASNQHFLLHQQCFLPDLQMSALVNSLSPLHKIFSTISQKNAFSVLLICCQDMIWI